jgi:saccharopine dehydrogenase-like NADP-dependent oxidoreductase
MIKALKAAGFLDHTPIKVKGTDITPFEFSTEILFKAWKLDPNEKEFTVMRIILEGVENGIAKKIVYDLYDEYDPSQKLSSMARTTGFTATAAADMIINNVFNKKGVFPPEYIGKHPDCFNYIMKYLSERNVKYIKTETII